MQNINKVFITGNVSRDAELKATASGTSVLLFGIASNESRQNGQGEWEDRAHFFDIVVYGKRADSLHKILRKGMHVTISGKLRYSSWEKDGQKRSRVDIVADDIELPPKGQAPQPTQAAPQAQYQQQAYPVPQPQYQAQNQAYTAPRPAYEKEAELYGQPQYTQQQLENPATWNQAGVYEDIPF